MSSKITAIEDSTWSLFEEGFFAPAEKLDDGRDYCCDWRWRKTLGYLRSFRGIPPAKGESVMSIQNENDQVIIDAFIGAAHGDYGDNSARWAIRAVHSNRIKSGASQIKAMILARVPTAVIADQMETTPAAIVAFEQLFFDVSKYIEKPAYVSSLFAPFQTVAGIDDESPASAEEAKERMWMMVGYYMGYESLKSVMYRKMILSSAELKEFDDAVSSMMQMARFDYVATMRTYGNARPADWEKSLAFDTIRTNAQLVKLGQKEGDFSGFYSALLADMTQNLGALPSNSGKVRLQALIAGKSEDLDRAFGPKEHPRDIETGVVDFLQHPRQIARTLSV